MNRSKTDTRQFADIRPRPHLNYGDKRKFKRMRRCVLCRNLYAYEVGSRKLVCPECDERR